MKEYPLVLVVIPAHNRKDKLIRLINSILQSNYPKDRLEIIVVDSASCDGTFYSKPLLALGVIVLKSLEYISAGLGYLAGIKALRSLRGY